MADSVATSPVDREEAARRNATFADEQRHDDNLASAALDLVAIDQALAACHGLPNERAIATRLGTGMGWPAGGIPYVDRALARLRGRPGLGQRHQRRVA